ncbi:unnamed protein product [marine sediment metagenome]|uniref:Uncharacterized protein n=1 Tax=marine sediment metagenome TaxID=412755 RepID=X0ZAE0_9ZZZZ
MGAKYLILVRTRVDDSIQKFQLVYDQTAGSTASDATKEAIDAWEAQCLPELVAILSVGTDVLSIHCRKLDGDSRPTWRKNLVGEEGTRSGSPLSAQNCLIFNLRNGAGLLKRPGRLFISGCSKTDIDQVAPTTGGWLAALLDPLASNFATAIKAIPAGGGSLFEGNLVVRQYHNQNPDPPTYTYVAVDTVDATLEIGSQMARKGRETGWVAIV